MNKEITIYELLGLIKDGQAPKGFKYSGYEWIYNYESSAYWNGKGVEFEDYMENSLIDCLNDKVEIIEEDKKIEKTDHLIGYDIRQFEDLREYVEITTNDLFDKTNKIIDKINEIIDEIEKLKEDK